MTLLQEHLIHPSMFIIKLRQSEKTTAKLSEKENPKIKSCEKLFLISKRISFYMLTQLELRQ